jgi:hypothetical protein
MGALATTSTSRVRPPPYNGRMKAIGAAVTSKLQAQRGQEEAVALWEALWAAYQRGGGEGAEEHLALLRQLPGEDDGTAEEVEP